MADPAIITCTVDTWVPVAINVTTGLIDVKSTKPAGYLRTFRDTGNAAPTDDTDALKMSFTKGAEINSSVAIDVYVKAIGKEGLVIVAL